MMFDIVDESYDVTISTVLLSRGLPHHFVLMMKLLNIMHTAIFVCEKTRQKLIKCLNLFNASKKCK